MTESVTCVIPVHNGAVTIERAVDSAIEAGCDEVAIYSDASTDDTNKILETLSKTCKQIRWVGGNVRVGAATARNYSICYNTPDVNLVICLDADDELVNIKELIDAYELNTFVYGNHYEINGDSVTHHKGAPIGTLPNKLVSGVTFLFAKSDWQKVGGFNPNYAFCEDYSFMCALVNAGVQSKYIDTTVYNRYLRPDGNERTILAGEYWNFYHQMCRRDYPNVFNRT